MLLFHACSGKEHSIPLLHSVLYNNTQKKSTGFDRKVCAIMTIHIHMGNAIRPFHSNGAVGV